MTLFLLVQVLESALVASFGSVDGFKQQFSEVASRVFGSGYAWLYMSKTAGTLHVGSSANQV